MFIPLSNISIILSRKLYLATFIRSHIHSLQEVQACFLVDSSYSTFMLVHHSLSLDFPDGAPFQSHGVNILTSRAYISRPIHILYWVDV